MRTTQVLLLVTAIILHGCEDPDPVQPSAIIDISIKDLTYYADGSTEIAIVTRIPKDASATYRSVALTTTGGLFSNGTAEITRDLRLKSIDTVYVTAGVTPGKFSVGAKTGETGKEYSDEDFFTLLPLPPDSILKSLEHLGLDVMLADGISESVINMVFGIKTSITIATDKGNLHRFGEEPQQKIEFTAEPDKLTSVIYDVSNAPGSCTIQISTSASSFERLIAFTIGRAYAEAMVIELPRVTIDSAGDNVLVKAVLKRNIGKVSPGALVQFEAFETGTGTPVGYFDHPLVQSTSDELAESSYYLSPNEIAVGKSITMRSTSLRADGNNLVVTQILTVK